MVTPFPRRLCKNSSNAARSCLADGMERAETVWPEVTGAERLVCGIHGGCRGAGVC